MESGGIFPRTLNLGSR